EGEVDFVALLGEREDRLAAVLAVFVDRNGTAFEHHTGLVVEAQRRHGMPMQLALVEEQFASIRQSRRHDRRHRARAAPYRDRRRDAVLEQLAQLAARRARLLPR